MSGASPVTIFQFPKGRTKGIGDGEIEPEVLAFVGPLAQSVLARWIGSPFVAMACQLWGLFWLVQCCPDVGFWEVEWVHSGRIRRPLGTPADQQNREVIATNLREGFVTGSK
jgi:hypothetical protein